MRILQVIPYFPPAYAFGGPVKAAYLISRELAKKGHDVTVYTTDVGDFNSRLKVSSYEVIEKVKVYRFNNLSLRFVKKLKFFITPKLIPFLSKEIRKFDIIHLHEYRTFQNIVIHRYAKKHSIPYILQARGSISRIGSWPTLKWIYDVFFGYRILRDSSGVIALNHIEAEKYRFMGIPKEKIAIVPNGIDLSEYANLPPKGSFKEKYNIPLDKKIVLYLGRIHKIKGIDLLIKAYMYLINYMNFKDIILVIAGPDDGFLDEIKALIKKLRIKDILLTGPLYGRDKLEAFVDSEVYVLPSRYETFPNTILEAYACSKPVIASNVEAISDIVLHKKTGLLFKVGDIKDLAYAIAYVLTHPVEALEMGREANKFVKDNFSIERIINLFEMLYEKILRSSAF